MKLFNKIFFLILYSFSGLHKPTDIIVIADNSWISRFSFYLLPEDGVFVQIPTKGEDLWFNFQWKACPYPLLFTTRVEHWYWCIYCIKNNKNDKEFSPDESKQTRRQNHSLFQVLDIFLKMWRGKIVEQKQGERTPQVLIALLPLCHLWWIDNLEQTNCTIGLYQIMNQSYSAMFNQKF